ncbi:MAG: serine/threonine-protein kinase [Deltaproteobacteria bacterium]|nr:serine/threonine-protein kinase [Deltaproteobacteria bacterium]
MQGQDTVRENQDVTVRENQDAATVRENQDANATVREGQSAANPKSSGVGTFFHEYRIVRQLPTRGSEADIFILEKDGRQYVLKQYRYGIEPKREILQGIKGLGESHPHEFIRILEADFDAASGRWYEIQEYAEHGSLQTVMADPSLLTDAQRATFFNDVAREITNALNILHQNNLLHLDLKPSNILLRAVSPLDLVLIDFGIATSLDSDMSKKFTQARGTPMYQSPESYSGGVGRPADWWGLGMILLEIAAGKHPFRGLGNSVIMEWVLTKPAPIPENLDTGQKELLRGLLTRDPEKRWGYKQVARWLSGERNIPQHFENAPTAQTQSGKGTLTPVTFMGALYRNPADLAAAFLKNELAWEKGKAFLLRGYVRQWLEKNDEFETAVDIDHVLSGTEDNDEKLFRFTQRFGHEVPFAFGGHLITLENLLLFAGKALKRQQVTAMEQKIVDSLSNGLLLSCLEFYKQQGQISESLRDLETVLQTVKGKPKEQIAKILDVFAHPEKYASLLNGSDEGLSSAGLGRLGSILQRIGLRRNEQTRTENTSPGDMSIQEIAKRISALEEQEKRKQQEQIEQERREQERREQERKDQEKREQEQRKQQERFEQERRERERREQQERLEQERREQERRRQQERLEQERRAQERRRQQESLERQRRARNINRRTIIPAFFAYIFLFNIFNTAISTGSPVGIFLGIILIVVPIIIIRRFTSLSRSIFISVVLFIISFIFGDYLILPIILLSSLFGN